MHLLFRGETPRPSAGVRGRVREIRRARRRPLGTVPSAAHPAARPQPWPPGLFTGQVLPVVGGPLAQPTPGGTDGPSAALPSSVSPLTGEGGQIPRPPPVHVALLAPTHGRMWGNPLASPRFPLKKQGRSPQLSSSRPRSRLVGAWGRRWPGVFHLLLGSFPGGMWGSLSNVGVAFGSKCWLPSRGSRRGAV